MRSKPDSTPIEAVPIPKPKELSTHHSAKDSRNCSTAPLTNERNSENCSTAPLFEPDKIYFDSATSKYLVDTGEIYRVYARKAAVKRGLARTLGEDDAELALNDLEIDCAIDWFGDLAGHKRGPITKAGYNLLVKSGPKIPDPDKKCSFDLLDSIISQAFANEAKSVFLGWLKGGVEAIRKELHCPAPMLVLAGGVNSGKSLLAWIVCQLFGGRQANPYKAWCGENNFNDDLVGSELLLLDDCNSSTSMAKRKSFGAKFKEANYSSEVQVNTKYKSSLSARPVWRVMLCCNEEPENLSVIPPLTDDLSDKIILLQCNKIVLPVDASTPDGKIQLQQIIRSELPGLLAHLESFEIPNELSDSRAGVVAWKDSLAVLQTVGTRSTRGDSSLS